jgi:hypothetical protein
LRSGFKPARGSRLGAKSVGSDFTGSRRMSNFKESPSPPYASGYGILRLRPGGQNIPSRIASSTGKSSGPSADAAAFRPTCADDVLEVDVASERDLRTPTGSTLRDCVLYSSESALGVLQTCTGETAAPPASSRPVSVGGRVYSADVPVGHCDHGPKDPHRFT